MNIVHKCSEFNYCTFSLAPYTGKQGSSSRLLKDLLQKLSTPPFLKNGAVIDRFAKRSGNSKRKLVHISVRFEGSKRCYGRLAMIKDIAPFFWKGKDVIEEIEKPENSEFIEITNYVVHFDETTKPIMMVEYNYAGPRLSDIEFYFRQVASENRIAKNIGTSLHLSVDYQNLGADLTNLFSVQVKVSGSRLLDSRDGNWHKSLTSLKNDSGYKDVRLEFNYGKAKLNDGSYRKNIMGLDYARSILKWLKAKGSNIEQLEDLKMEFETKDTDGPIGLDFLKNKRTSRIKIPTTDKGIISRKEFIYATGVEFNHYLKTGETNLECD